MTHVDSHQAWARAMGQPANMGDTPSIIVLTRVFDAPVDLIYKLWTDPRYVALWWGVEGATILVCALDVRPGGYWRIDMRTLSGKTYRNEGLYLEVEENRRLVYSDVPDPGLQEWKGEPPDPRLHTVTFSPRGSQTEVTLEIRMNSADDKQRMIAFGMPNGIEQGFDRLARLIALLPVTTSDRHRSGEDLKQGDFR